MIRRILIASAFRWRAVLALLAAAICLHVSALAAEQSAEPKKDSEQTSPEPAPEQEPAAESETPSAEEPAPAESTDEKAEQDTAAPRRRPVSGRVEASIDAALSDGDDDIDLDQQLQLNFDPPNHDKLHVRSLFWLREDFGSDNKRSYVRDIDDSFDSDVHGDVVYLHLDIDDVWGDSTLRIGRQRINEGTAYNRIDGIFFKKDLQRWQWYAYAGWQASLYDHPFDDPAVGGGASYQIAEGTRVAVDAYWIEEDRIHSPDYYRWRLSNLLYRDYPRRVEGELHDSSIAISIWQAVTDNIRVMGRYEWLDSSAQRLTLQATGFISALNTSFEVRYRQLFDEIEDRASDLTSYYRILGPQQEYQELRLVLHRPLTERFTLSLEGEFRNTDNDYPGPETNFWDRSYDYADKSNQDFNHYTATLSADKLPWNLNAMISAEYWDIDEFDDSWQFGGEVTKKWDAWSFTLGATYAEYDDYTTQYNFWPSWRNEMRSALFSRNNSSLSKFYYINNFTVNLRDVVPVDAGNDIVSVFAEARWDIDDKQNLNASVTFEEDDSEDSPYWRLRAGYTRKF